MDISIPLFPFDSAAITVTTTVWIGVVISVLFNLRLGWTLSGLVIPGFLVPLMMARPTATGVILFEAVVTYAIAYIISEGPRKLSYWSSFFGRDRFFVILLVSVLVRAVFDGYLFPWLGQMALDQYGINIDYKNSLQSYGLIVVALLANYFWKPGFIRGFPPIATCVFLTYLVVQGVLVQYTNFSVGNFQLLYDDISSTMLASPKAYIIVLTTAYLASWMNLRYAWDFNGILIPALLGLLWHEPSKILVSGAECLMLCYVGSLLLKTPLLRGMTIQGSRKILFFFSICFCYRLLASHVIETFLPTWNATDFFGYGYLLSTLMAIKIHDKQKSLRILVGTGKVSLLGAVAGSMIGFGFYCGPSIQLEAIQSQPIPNVTTVALKDHVYTETSLTQLLRRDKTLLYQKRQAESYVVPTEDELKTFRQALVRLKNMRGEVDRETIRSVVPPLRSLNYQVTVVADRYVYLHENSPANGWGMYVIDTRWPDGACIEVPAPLGEWSTLETGASLLKLTPCCGLAIAGAPRQVNAGGKADVINASGTIFEVFDRVFGSQGVLQVRGYTRSAYRQLADTQAPMESAQSRLYVCGDIPRQISLATLKKLSGSLDVRWNASPVANRLRDDRTASVIELFLNRDDRRRLVGQQATQGSAFFVQGQQTNVDIVHGDIRDWLMTVKEQIVPQGSNLYVPAQREDMLYMDQEVLAPLMKMLAAAERPVDAQRAAKFDQWLNEEMRSELSAIHRSARAQGYAITVVIDAESNECYVVLAEADQSQRKGWGTFVFRPGLADPFAVEIPRPLFESRSFDFGVNLFQRPRGAALIIAGAHPRANMNGTSDISKASNKTNLFNLVRHVLLRHMSDRPFLISQARAIQAPVEADIVVATDDGATLTQNLTPLKDQLLQQLTDDELSITFVDGRKETAGYELGVLMQATSVQVSQNKEVVSLWLSPSLRTKFRQQSENHALTAQFDACNIPTIQQKLITYLSSQYDDQSANADAILSQPIPAAIRRDLELYSRNFDIVRLLSIIQNNPDWSFVRVQDPASGQSFLSISQEEGEFPTVMNVTGAISQRVVHLNRFDRQAIVGYIRSRALWLQSVDSARTAASARPVKKEPQQ